MNYRATFRGTRRSAFCVLSALFVWFHFGTTARAQQECDPGQDAVCVVADNQDFPSPDVWIGRGNAVVRYEDYRIEADSITVNKTTKEVTATDHVNMTRAAEKLDGDNLSLNYETHAGTMFHVTGSVGGYFFTAERADRFEDGHYILHNATITTCDKEPAGWNFRLRQAFVIPGNRVTAGGSVFSLQGVPLFYFPYLMVPTVERDRATGFLIPSTSTSTTKGRSVRESFYWAINRSADATFSGEYFSKRGPAGQIDFRAVPNANSHLNVTSFFVRDRLGQGGQSARILDDSDFGNGYRGVADMNLVSSILFRQVFEDNFDVISSPIEHSTAFLTRNQESYSYGLTYQRTAIFFPNQPTVVLKNFPGFDLSLPERQIGDLPAYLSLDTSLGGVSRRDSEIKTPTFVQRVDVHPMVQIPVLKTSLFDWTNEAGVRETAYTHSRDNVGNGGALNRFLLEYDSEITGPALERDYGSWRHVIEPSVEYRYVSGADRFRDTIVSDEVDLPTDTSEVEYSITNRFFTTREILSWRIAQQRYFDPTFGGAVREGERNAFAPLLELTGFAFADGKRRFSPIVSNVRVSTSPSTSTDIQIDYDSERHRFEGAGISGGASRGPIFTNVAYFFRRSTSIQFPSNQLRGNFGYGNEGKPGFSFAMSAAYDIQRSLFQGSVAQVGYNWDCYGLSLEWMQVNLGPRQESRIRFAFSLKNIGAFGNIRRQDRIF